MLIFVTFHVLCRTFSPFKCRVVHLQEASTNPSMSLSEITSLQTTLNAALDTYKAELAAQQISEPSLNTSKPHPTDDISFLPTPAMFEARRAALACLVLAPLLYTFL
jgi:hypothetical protein